ncbi:hypothetical protein [Streptomyces sp. NPDC059874]|uniref:hypothetical protein n=1 Tax=Streptomyces sp. NPDC059874 TaxID=3346983 RepID=UPI0036608BE4
MAEEKAQPTSRSAPFEAADGKGRQWTRESALHEVGSDGKIDADERKNGDIT